MVGQGLSKRIQNSDAHAVKSAAEPRATPAASRVESRPEGMARACVRGLRASRRRSAIRFTSIAHVRAKTMQRTTRASLPISLGVGSVGGRARNTASTANGSANTECASLMSPAAARNQPNSAGIVVWVEWVGISQAYGGFGRDTLREHIVASRARPHRLCAFTQHHHDLDSRRFPGGLNRTVSVVQEGLALLREVGMEGLVMRTSRDSTRDRTLVPGALALCSMGGLARPVHGQAASLPDEQVVKGVVRDFLSSHPEFNLTGSSPHIAGLIDVSTGGLNRPVLSGGGFVVERDMGGRVGRGAVRLGRSIRTHRWRIPFEGSFRACVPRGGVCSVRSDV